MGIAPPAVLEGLIAGAAAPPVAGGRLFLYGPFARDGAVAEADVPFDEALKRLDPSFGLRDVGAIRELAAAHKLELAEEVFHEASDNYLLCLVQRARGDS